MSDSPAISVVIRVKNEAPALRDNLRLLSRQTVDRDRVEIVVVDSGSTDGGVDVAREAADRLIQIPARGFNYGTALNIGTRATSAAIVLSVSAHVLPPDAGWLERMLSPFGDPTVACAVGQSMWPDRSQMTEPFAEDLEFARRHPEWGYSNAGGAFRSDLWRRRPFRADMPSSEDKDWAWYWMERGYRVWVDPGTAYHHDHRDDSPLTAYTRARREWEGNAMSLPLPSYGLGPLARQWWSDQEGYRSRARSRLDPKRVPRLLGTYRGRKRGEAWRRRHERR